MPTLDEWQQALATPRFVVVESSAELVQEIHDRQTERDAQRQQKGHAAVPHKNTLTQVAAFAPELQVEIVPAFLLNRLGVVTTPPIENLADISSTWAYLRYLWAFEIPPTNEPDPPLRLSDAARNIDFHQKGLLSDQIGVGMAAVLLGSHFAAPLAADVSVALDDPAWPIDLQYDTSPDYLFFDAPQESLFVVECKGTQTSRSGSVRQLQRGTEQLPSLIFTDGRTPTALVVATCLTTGGTRVLVVDPPGGKDDDGRASGRTERTGTRDWRVRDEARFARATRLISEAKLLSFAGAPEVAARKLENADMRVPTSLRPVPREPETTENEFGTFRGVRQNVSVGDGSRVEIFQGVELSLHKALSGDDYEQTVEKLDAFQARSRKLTLELERRHPVIETHEKNVLSVKSVGPDGALLEVRVRPG